MGEAFALTVRMVDAYGNTAQTFSDQVDIRSIPAGAGSSGYHFTDVDSGVHTFSLTFTRKGVVRISVSDRGMQTQTALVQVQPADVGAPPS